VALNGVFAQVPFPGKCPEVKIMDEFDVDAVSGHPTNYHNRIITHFTPT